MKPINSKLGLYIRKLRINQGDTLQVVSKYTDIDSPLLSKIERGVRLPTNGQIEQLSNYFGIQESKLKVLATAEKIIKQYGINEITYDAICRVEEELNTYLTNKRGGFEAKD